MSTDRRERGLADCAYVMLRYVHKLGDAYMKYFHLQCQPNHIMRIDVII